MVNKYKMVEAFKFTQMEYLMMVNGKMEKNMAMEKKRILLTNTSITVFGLKDKKMEKVRSFGKMAVGMMVSGKMVISMVKASSMDVMIGYIVVLGRIINYMVMVNLAGQMGRSTQVNM